MKFSDFERDEVENFEEYRDISKNFLQVAAKIREFQAEMKMVDRLL